MSELFWKIIGRLDRRFDKPAGTAHNYKPGSEKMVDSQVPKAWAESARIRRSGTGLGPRDRS